MCFVRFELGVVDLMDYESLRKDLIDYFGSAMFSGFPMVVVELSEVERASNSELLRLARKVGFDLSKYEV